MKPRATLTWVISIELRTYRDALITIRNNCNAKIKYTGIQIKSIY